MVVEFFVFTKALVSMTMMEVLKQGKSPRNHKKKSG